LDRKEILRPYWKLLQKKLVVDKMITEIIPLDSYQTIYGEIGLQVSQ
jgi:hypothetical protein